MKNKKIFMIFGIIIVIVICIIAVIFMNRKNIRNTNLTNITLDNLKISEILDYNTIENYTNSDRYNGNYKYKFEEIVIEANNENNIKAEFIYNDLDNSLKWITIQTN